MRQAMQKGNILCHFKIIWNNVRNLQVIETIVSILGLLSIVLKLNGIKSPLNSTSGML